MDCAESSAVELNQIYGCKLQQADCYRYGLWLHCSPAISLPLGVNFQRIGYGKTSTIGYRNAAGIGVVTDIQGCNLYPGGYNRIQPTTRNFGYRNGGVGRRYRVGTSS